MRECGWRAVARLACGALLGASLVAPSPAPAQSAPPTALSTASPTAPPATPTAAATDDEIAVDAETVNYDQKGDILSASGDVLIRRGEMTLSADTVEVNRRSSEARALGDAVLLTPESEVRASAIFLNLESETGELQDAQITSDTMGYSLSGKRIEKGLGQRYRIEAGRFTTCICAEGAPDWSIAGDTLDVALDGYATLDGGTFEILDVPVLWLPKAAFPVFRDRQSGLLIPRVGISNRRGFQLLQPFYWAIDKTQDATLSFDLETSLRVGLIGEYRYAYNRNTQGELEVAYFNDFRQNDDVTVAPGADPDTPNNRWAVRGNHVQRFDALPGLEGYLDALVVGDDQFLREMNTFAVDVQQEVAQRTRPFTTSQLGVLQRWDRAMLIGEAVFYQDLVGPTVVLPDGELTEDESLVIQRLPEARFVSQKQLGLGLMGDLTGSVTNFQRSLGLAGFRGDIKPSAQLRLPLGRTVFGSVRAAFRETAYGLTENEMAGGFTGANLVDGPFIDLPSTSNREIVELRGDLGTQFGRVFNFPYFGLDKLKHVVEPQLEYLYIPPVNQDDLPVFDGIDRINKRSLFTYGVATRLLGRSADAAAGTAGHAFELTRLSIAQSYDFLRDIPPTQMVDDDSAIPCTPGDPTNPCDAAQGDHFSDIDFSLRVNPSPITAVRVFATYDPSENNLSSATVGVRLKEPLAELDPGARPRLLTRATFNVEYRFITDSILQLLDSSVSVPLTERIAVLYAMRYDINEGSFLENYAGLRLLSACDCWALSLGFSDTRNPNEIQVQAQFTLAGLGAATGRGFEAY